MRRRFVAQATAAAQHTTAPIMIAATAPIVPDDADEILTEPSEGGDDHQADMLEGQD